MRLPIALHHSSDGPSARDIRCRHEPQAARVNVWNVDPAKFDWLLRFWDASSAAAASGGDSPALPPFVCIAEADVAFNATRVGEILMGAPWAEWYGRGRGVRAGGAAPLVAHVQHLWGDNWREFERANFCLVCAGAGPPPRWARALLGAMARVSATRCARGARCPFRRLESTAKTTRSERVALPAPTFFPRYRRFVPLTALVGLFGRRRAVLEWRRHGGCTHLRPPPDEPPPGAEQQQQQVGGDGGGNWQSPCTYVHFARPKVSSIPEAVLLARAMRERWLAAHGGGGGGEQKENVNNNGGGGDGDGNAAAGAAQEAGGGEKKPTPAGGG